MVSVIFSEGGQTRPRKLGAVGSSPEPEGGSVPVSPGSSVSFDARLYCILFWPLISFPFFESDLLVVGAYNFIIFI